jgi:ATP synthase in type III secretion protein N
MADLDALRKRLKAGLVGAQPMSVRGRVVAVRGLTVRATIPGARVGDGVTIERRDGALDAEVVAFEDDLAVLMPLGDLRGIGLDDPVAHSQTAGTFLCGPGVLGRILGPTGAPCDGDGPIGETSELYSVYRSPPDPLRRQRVREPMPTGVRVIDALCTLAVGQRVGVFAGPGAGKTTLLGQIARGADTDVIVVGLVGERGREVRELLEGVLGNVRDRACAVIATSDAAPVLRVRAAHVAMSVAEYFRDQGKRVLLLLDSATRLARAQREVGVAAGEPAVRRGIPPSVFSMLPRLLERAGPGETGSITAIVTALSEGGDLDDPIAEELRGLLDGHITLDATLGHRGRWPAVDVNRSLSRAMPDVVSIEHRDAARRALAFASILESNRDLMALGAYAPGRDKSLDEALRRRDALEALLTQRAEECHSYEQTIASLRSLTKSLGLGHCATISNE